MPYCGGCGESISDEHRFCPSCGKAVAKPANTEVAVKETSKNACPICHLVDKVEKVSEIRRHEIQDLEGTMPVSHSYSDKDGHVHSYTSQRGFTGTQSTQLAKALCPPPVPKLPKKHTFWQWLLLGLLVYTSGLYLFGLFILFTGGYPIIQICFGLLGFPLLIFFFWRWRKRYKKDESQYPVLLAEAHQAIEDRQMAMKNWDKLYYCYRDGHVYLPGTGTSAKVENMIRYIYYPDDSH